MTNLAGASGGDALVGGDVGRHLPLWEHQLARRQAVAAVLALHAQNCIHTATSMGVETSQRARSMLRVQSSNMAAGVLTRLPMVAGWPCRRQVGRSVTGLRRWLAAVESHCTQWPSRCHSSCRGGRWWGQAAARRPASQRHPRRRPLRRPTTSLRARRRHMPAPLLVVAVATVAPGALQGRGSHTYHGLLP